MRSLSSSLRLRLSFVFVGLAIGPILLVSVITSRGSFARLEDQALKLQIEIAALAESEIRNYLQSRVHELSDLDDIYGLRTQERSIQRKLLSNMLLHNRDYQELALVDSRGQEQIRLSLTSAILDEDLKTRVGREEIRSPLTNGQIYFGQVRFDESIREPLITIAVPLVDLRSGAVSNILIADLRLKKIWDLLGDFDQPQEGDVYVIDRTGLVVAHANPGIVLSRRSVTLPLSGSRTRGLTGQEMIFVSRSLNLGEQELRIIVEQSVSSALALATNNLQISMLIGALALGLSGLLVVLGTRQVVKPVEALAASARSIVSGDLSHRNVVTRKDEIGDLEQAFNVMAEQLSTIIQSLELRVVERTQELEQTGTEIETLLAELESKNAELEQFAFTVSHDLKSPLVTIKGFLGYLKKDTLDDNKSRMLADIDRISEAAERMHIMLEELLDLSRLGRKVNPAQEINMEDLALEAVRLVSGRLRERKVRVEIHPGLPAVCGDLPRLRQVLENLVDNAVKYLGDQPEPLISIGVRGDAKEPVFFVQDNGLGIEAEYQDKIFGLFEQLDPNSEGSGMGLAITRRIIELHGGTIWVESRGRGQGSTFCFTIPGTAARKTRGDHEGRTISHLAG